MVSLLVVSSLAVAFQAGAPAGPVPVERLAARREALLDRVGDGVVVIRSGSLRVDDPPNSDYPQDSDYREDNDFFYLTGLESPESWLLLVARKNGPDETYLYLPARNAEEERWTGPKLGVGEEAARLTGIPVANQRVADRVGADLLGWLGGGRASGPLWIKQDERTKTSEVLGAILPKLSARPRDLLPLLAELRLVKDGDEIRRLTRAAEISAKGHIAAMKAARPGVYEYQIEAAAEATFRSEGAERVAYPSIVGSGINGTTLHYDKNRRQTEAGDLIVMDMAADFGYYSADVTRTIPVSGRFTERQRALYDLVLGAQQAAVDSVRPGITLVRLDQIAREYLHRHSGDLCGRQPCETYFIHGLSHWIGMDVHDVGQLRTPLAAGMTFTIEPGVYLPDEKIGIRIEDDVLVTESGARLLSAGVPRKPAEIEQLMTGTGSR